jgi:hypothetical protein
MLKQQVQLQEALQCSSGQAAGDKPNARDHVPFTACIERQVLVMTDLCREASGQGWNQSMTVELMVARKR